MAYAYRVNGDTIRLTLDTRLVAIRFRGDRPLGAQARAARAWAPCDPFGAVEIPDEDIAIMLSPTSTSGRSGWRRRTSPTTVIRSATSVSVPAQMPGSVVAPKPRWS